LQSVHDGKVKAIATADQKSEHPEWYRPDNYTEGSSQRYEANVQFDIVIPVIMSCALLWWVSRGMTWTTRLMAAAITLAVILCILLFERSRN